MPGDYSRFTDNPLEHFSRVLMQQGKVQLDADWNEEVEIGIRRERLQALDVFGRAAVPKTTPKGFEITALPNDLGIGAGRIYVDGLLVEAFEQEKPLTYSDQPFLRHRPPLPIAQLLAGKGLVYLHVREREVTHAEKPSLIEPALGDIDTATRTQTYWQVKILPLKERFSELKCGSDLTTVFKPTDARLTTHVDLPEEEPDPCQVPEIGGFRDVENRHYRVEIHGTTHFKFARDPVVAEIEEITDSSAQKTSFRVKRIGRDPVLRFKKDDVVEFMNERMFLDDQPGVMARVANVDEAKLEITIDKGTSDGIGNVAVAAALQPRLIRWDQRGNPDATPPELLIPIDTTGKIPLEAGISVELKGTEFRNGDYWMFAARAANRSVGPLVDAPPRGVTQHYATLAIITGLGTKFPVVESDCRTLWPPECDCECAACVDPVGHNSGRATIQMAIDEVNEQGGGTICFRPGAYFLKSPLVLKQVHFIRLKGHGAALLIYPGSERHMLLIDRCRDITVENLILWRGPEVDGGFDAVGILVRDCLYDTVIDHCLLWMPTFFSDSPTRRGIAIALDGVVENMKVVDCELDAGGGIRSFYEIGRPSQERSLTSARALHIRNNRFVGTIGIWIEAIGLSATIRDNAMDVVLSGVHLNATTFDGAQNLIDGNRIDTRETGIQFYGDRTTASNNVVRGKLVRNPDVVPPVHPRGNGIVVRAESVDLTTSACHVLANRCTNLSGSGVAVLERAEGLMIKNNFIADTAGGGVVLSDSASRSDVTVENNHIRNVALGHDTSVKGWYGIRLASQCDGTVAANTVAGVGTTALATQQQFLSGAGIRAEAPNMLRIHENDVTSVAPGIRNDAAGIDVVAPFGSVEITNNHVKVESSGRPGGESRTTHALRVEDPPIDAAGWVAVAVDLEFAAWMYFNLFREGETALSVGPRRSDLLVRSNHFDVGGTTAGDASAVRIIEPRARCTFGGNYCIASFGFNNPVDATVFIHGQKVVFDSNQVLGAARLSAEIFTGNKDNDHWTILGNITDSKLSVNGASLQPPWNALNRIG